MPPAPEPSVAGDRDTPRTFNDGDVGVLLAGLVDGLTVHDEGGRYLQVSASFEELTGFGAAQLTGHSPFDLELFHPEDVDHAVEVQADALRTGEPWRLLYRLQRSDGAFVWVESTGRAIDHEDGLRFVVVTREAAQHESLIQQLGHERQTRLQLDELAARQQRFLTIMSHRARTPLTSVLGMAQTLQAHGDDLDPARRQALLERLRGNAEDLMHLLDDVIEADHLTRADVMLKRRVVGVRALVEEVVADMTGALDTVTIDVPHDLRAVIDRAKVARMLETLLGNAFKHAGVGAAVRMAAESTNEGIKLVVEDDGPGIPAAVRDEIFQPFFQADPDDADPGAGLGLYLVSELAGLHLGRAWATDRPGGGARLCVSLPRPRADAPVADSTAAEADDQAASALRPAAHRFVTRLLSTLRDRVDMDLVYLSVLDDTAQHVLAGAGKLGVGGVEPGRRMPLEDTFCARMVNDELDHVVGDTSAHPVTADLPPTADGLACWIGVPVHLPSGQVLGTLCCADSAPRPELSQAAADELRSFAQILGDQLADEGFIDGTAFDATGRVANVLTTDAAMHTVLQPIVELDGGSVSGLEALARFPGHDRAPGLWFADAARCGLLVDLEVLAVERAIHRLPDLPSDAYLAINVSPRTVLSRELMALLDGHPPDRLVLEMTEHAAIDDYGPLRDALAPHRAAGLRIAVDDVGTGHAGLGHLVHLDPDIVKVDRSLVEALDTEPTRAAAVEGVAGMAAHLGADLVAEGVERPATLAAAADIGFSHVQGYLLGRPERDPDPEAVTDRTQQLLAQRSPTAT